MRTDMSRARTMEVRRRQRVHFALSVLTAVALPVLAVVLMTAGAPAVFVAVAVLLAVVASTDAALVLDAMLSKPPESPAKAPEPVLEPIG